MSAATLNKINCEVASLRQEVDLLRSLLVSVVTKDKEGEYKPVFIKEIKSALSETPGLYFKGAKSFLKQIDAV